MKTFEYISLICARAWESRTLVRASLMVAVDGYHICEFLPRIISIIKTVLIVSGSKPDASELLGCIMNVILIASIVRSIVRHVREMIVRGPPARK